MSLCATATSHPEVAEAALGIQAAEGEDTSPQAIIAGLTDIGILCFESPLADGLFLKELSARKLKQAEAMHAMLDNEMRQLLVQLTCDYKTNPADKAAMDSLLLGSNTKGAATATRYRRAVQLLAVAKAKVDRLKRCVGDVHALLITEPEKTFIMELDADRMKELAYKRGNPATEDVEDRQKMPLIQLCRDFLGDKPSPSGPSSRTAAGAGTGGDSDDEVEVDKGAGGAGGSGRKRGRKTSAQVVAELAASVGSVTGGRRSGAGAGGR